MKWHYGQFRKRRSYGRKGVVEIRWKTNSFQASLRGIVHEYMPDLSFCILRCIISKNLLISPLFIISQKMIPNNIDLGRVKVLWHCGGTLWWHVVVARWDFTRLKSEERAGQRHDAVGSTNANIGCTQRSYKCIFTRAMKAKISSVGQRQRQRQEQNRASKSDSDSASAFVLRA